MKHLATLAFLTCLIGLVIPANGQDFTYQSTEQAVWEAIPDTIYTPEAVDTVGLYILADLYEDRNEKGVRGQQCGDKWIIKPYLETSNPLIGGVTLYPCYEGDAETPVGRLPVTDTAEVGDEGSIILRDDSGAGVLAITIRIVDTLPAGKSGTVIISQDERADDWNLDNLCEAGSPWAGSDTCTGNVRPDVIGTGTTKDSYDLAVPDNTITSAEGEPIPTQFLLNHNYPNPFNPSTTIEYKLQNSEDVTLTVYDMRGAEVALLVDGVRAAGTHTVHFNGSDLPSGTYVYILDVNGSRAIQTMVLVK